MEGSQQLNPSELKAVPFNVPDVNLQVELVVKLAVRKFFRDLTLSLATSHFKKVRGISLSKY